MYINVTVSYELGSLRLRGSFYVGSVGRLGGGIVTGHTSTAFRKFWKPSVESLFLYISSDLCGPLHVKVLQSSGKGSFYDLVPYYVYIFVYPYDGSVCHCRFHMCKTLAALRSVFSIKVGIVRYVCQEMNFRLFSLDGKSNIITLIDRFWQ